jgi:MFS family permease
MGFIDSSVTALALPAIRDTLGARQDQVEWVGVAYLLTLSATILCGGAMGDRFGTLRLFRAGIWGFMACSALCALAPGVESLIAARAAQGLAAAAMVPGSMAIIAKAYPRETRGKALGLWAAAATATTISGPMLGGAILTVLGPHAWRMIFALNLPFGIGALVLLARHARADAGRPGTPVDLIGAGLATLGLGGVTAGLSFGGPWIVAAGTLALAVFLWVEARSKAPMIPLAMFRNPAFAGVNAATLFLYFAITGLGFYIPTVAITAFGLPPWEVTLALLPGSVLTAAVMAHAGEAQQGAASGINNATARVSTLMGVAVMGRVARGAYGPGAPGFGLAANLPAHAAAGAHAFATIAVLAAVCSALAAGVAALTVRPVPTR